MTTFEFKMTPRAYYAGWRVLQRQQLRLQWVFCALCAVLATAGILLYFLLQDVEETAILPALSGIVAAMAVLLPWVRRSSVLREFGNSPTLTQPFTLRLEEQALQVWSKFEQYTLPWQGITYAKETKDYIILIGCYRMGLFVIEKADCVPADVYPPVQGTSVPDCAGANAHYRHGGGVDHARRKAGSVRNSRCVPYGHVRRRI